MSDSIHIRALTSLDDFKQCVRLQKQTWGEDCSEIVPVSLLRSTPRMGGVIAGAFDDAGRMVGMVFGLTGLSDGTLVHWSDMLAVRPGLRDRGIGERLKRYQRDVLLPTGVRRIDWTFDPLESRNAYLNFRRLGVIAAEYLVDYYGATDSPLHEGLPTDRVVANWHIRSRRVTERLGRRPSGADTPPLEAAAVALDARREAPWPRPL
ncbi:MAG: hypothetical protein ACRELD_16530, partial [Longimicrobiales bacterium]